MRSVLLLSTCLFSFNATAGDLWRLQHANDPDAACDVVCEWVKELKQPDNPFVSCCGEADRFEADEYEVDKQRNLIAIITDGKGIIPNGTKILVPERRVKWDRGNPTGHGQIFINVGSQTVYCYVPPGGV